MKLYDFIMEYPDWRARLSAPPYNLKINDDGCYTIFKYDMIESDMREPIVREARGCILKNCGQPDCKVVCYPFDKFFNAEEAANDVEIDWSTASVQEKVDGSLMKLWYDDRWHLSTNGTINAANANAYDGCSFKDLWNEAFHRNENAHYLSLDTNYTYMFELVSPFTQIVIEYPDPDIYYLGCRNMITGEEEDKPCPWKGVKTPKRYSLSTYEDCKAAAAALGSDGEGFVVCDSAFRRIKVKSPAYVAAHRLVANKPLSAKLVLEMIDEGILDDFTALKPSTIPFVEGVLAERAELLKKMDISWNKIKYVPAGKLFAEYALKYPWSGYLFARKAGKDFKLDAKYMLKLMGK